MPFSFWLNIVFVVILVSIILMEVAENGRPMRTLAWILVLIFLPVVGLVLYFFFGRDVMTCCANDIRFIPLAAECAEPARLKNLGWYTLTARVDVRDLPNVYEGPGPVLHAVSLEPAEAPEQEVATFY